VARSSTTVKVNDAPGYWPVSPSIVATFLVVLTLLGFMLAVNLVSYAYGRLGLSHSWVLAVLFASVIGSWFNIPVATLRGDVVCQPTFVRVFGMLYVVPRWVRVGTKVIAVNVGGSLIPVALTAYLVWHNRIGWQALAATALVAVPVHAAARVIPGVGVVVPTLIPPVCAAIVAGLMNVPAVAALAYASGTLGTLIGADLLNLHRVKDFQGPVVSIGGAGTFDGIFVTGIVAVVLTAL
jgi:uncharacterized membrane protein